MANLHHNATTADRLFKRACREARFAEFLGSQPLGVVVARMARAISEGRIEEAMVERDRIRNEYSSQIGAMLMLAIMTSIIWAPPLYLLCEAIIGLFAGAQSR